MSSRLAALTASARPPFLLLAPLSAGLGLALANHHGAPLNSGRATLILATAVLAQLAVNLRNEAEDYRSGLDQLTQQTPFSGGSGYLPAHPQQTQWVANAGSASTLATALLGGWLAYQQPLLWPLGAVGLLLVWFYTSWITRRPWLCAIAPGVAFGPVMVVGSELAAGGEIHWQSLLTSGAVFCAVNNLLLLNQIPDASADRRVGRITLASSSPQLVGTAVVVSTVIAAALALFATGDLPPLARFVVAIPLLALAVAALRTDQVAREQLCGGRTATLALHTAAVMLLIALLNAVFWLG